MWVSLRKEEVYWVVVQTVWFYSSLFSSSGFLPASSLGIGSERQNVHTYTQHCCNCESKSFELFIQNSLFVVKLSDLFNAGQLSAMLETKTDENQGLLKTGVFLVFSLMSFSTCKQSALFNLWC